MAIKYKGLIAWALDHRVAIVLIAIGSFVVAIALPAVGLVGASFFGAEDQSEVNIAIETPPGSNLAYTRIKAEEAARMARAHKEVRFTYTTLGGQTGDVNTGNIYVRMLPKSDRSIGAEDFGRVLREEVGRIGGATMSVFTRLPGRAEADPAAAARRVATAARHRRGSDRRAGQAGERRGRCGLVDKGTKT